MIFAANRLGAIAMPINWRLAAAEVRLILEHAEAKVPRAPTTKCAAVAHRGERRSADDAGRRSGTRWPSLRNDAACRCPAWPSAGDDVHRLMYTSGTTGRPKGVMLSHANLAWKNLAHIVEFGFTGADLGLACGPLYHVGALDLTTTSLIACGATGDPPPGLRRRRRGRRARAVARSPPCGWPRRWSTLVMALPDIEARDLLVGPGHHQRRREDADPAHRTHPAHVPVGLVRRRLRAHRRRSRATPSSTGTASSPSSVRSGARACTSTSTSWDGDGRSVAPGEKGEVVLRGPKVFAGYWRDPDATAKAFEGGWFHTGDVGVRDEDGYLWIVDRLKDMIISGGENIAGSEVERVLYEHPAVVEAAVVGRPDERVGRGARSAFVVLRTEASAGLEAELIEHCRSQLARYKVPKAVTFLDALPRNPSGKVLKRELGAGASAEQPPSRGAARPAPSVSVFESPSNRSSTRARRRNRWNGCSRVKPMPASTCWQVLGGEADGPAGDGLGRGAAHRVGAQLPRRVQASLAPSTATSVSASLWRTAWNWAMGRSNWTRSRAWTRASSSIARDAPTSSWASASRPAARGVVGDGAGRRSQPGVDAAGPEDR